MARAVVIGAGPAGSVAAMLLARGGWDVRLIEQTVFPRHKVCGECLSALGLSVLRRTGLLNRLIRLHPTPLRQAWIYDTDRRSLKIDLPEPMWGLSRHAMDPALLAAALDAGVQVIQPARVESVTPGATPRVKVRRDREATSSEVECDVVVIADGKGAFPHRSAKPTGDLGVKGHFQGVSAPAGCIGLYAVDGSYVGLAPIERGSWNVAMSIPAEWARDAGGDLARVFDRIVTQNPLLGEHLADATQQGEWMASPLPRFAVRNDWADGTVPIGTAAAALEPIGGEGMGLAMRSAELAAEALLRADGALSPAQARELAGHYQGLWRRRRIACRAAAFAATHPRLRSAAMSVVLGFPAIAGIWAGLAGKSRVRAPADPGPV